MHPEPVGPPTPLRLPHCGALQLSVRALCRVSENGHSWGRRGGRTGGDPQGRCIWGRRDPQGNPPREGAAGTPPPRDGAPAVGGIGGHPQKGAAGYPPGAGASADREPPRGGGSAATGKEGRTRKAEPDAVPVPPISPGSPRSRRPLPAREEPPTPPLCANGERPPAVPAAARGYGAAPAPGGARGGTAGTGCSQPPPAPGCPTRREAPHPPSGTAGPTALGCSCQGWHSTGPVLGALGLLGAQWLRCLQPQVGALMWPWRGFQGHFCKNHSAVA